MPRGIEGTRILPSILIPVHWERLVDFSMFVDRNAGRTIPLSGSCGSDEDEHIYHGHDVTSVTGLVLESEHAAQLQQQQLAEMHNLVTLSVKKAQVASYLVQLKDAMSVLPSDMEALREEYETVLKGSH
ncbi:hypothetical protein ERJ75_000990000 [Trypanosoma vivax]|nr:hypothetical protein ERJ75_000990000 [Trypanosoma vivax]